MSQTGRSHLLPTVVGLALILLSTSGCWNTEPSPPITTAGPGTPTWTATQEKFAADVAAEKVPEGIAAFQEMAVNAAEPPARRAAALRELGKAKDFESMPTVIAALDDQAREVRGEAQNAAKQIVGLGIRFRDYDSVERRQPAVAAYRRLHKLAQEYKVRYFIDLVPVLLQKMDDADETVRRHAGEDIVRLMDSSYDYRADSPHEERLRAISGFRKEWDEWNAPGSQMVEIRRDPEKLRAFKENLLKNIREKEAKGIPWTTDTKARDAAAETPSGPGG